MTTYPKADRVRSVTIELSVMRDMQSKCGSLLLKEQYSLLLSSSTVLLQEDDGSPVCNQCNLFIIGGKFDKRRTSLSPSPAEKKNGTLSDQTEGSRKGQVCNCGRVKSIIKIE